MIDASASMIEYMDETDYFNEYLEYDYDDWYYEDAYGNEYDFYDEDGELDWNKIEEFIDDTDFEGL